MAAMLIVLETGSASPSTTCRILEEIDKEYLFWSLRMDLGTPEHMHASSSDKWKSTAEVAEKVKNHRCQWC